MTDAQILEIAFNHRPIKTNDDLITFAKAMAAAQREEDAALMDKDGRPTAAERIRKGEDL